VLSYGSMTSAIGLLMACLALGVAKGVWNDCCVCSGVVVWVLGSMCVMLGLAGAWFLSLSTPLEATGTATAEPQQGLDVV
jgi:hypothetical protein